MRVQIELAKKQGLNWQTLVIEDAETEVKSIITQGFTYGATLEMLRIRIDRVVTAAVNDLQDEELKAAADKALRRLASLAYSTIQARLGKYPQKVVSSMVLLLNKPTNNQKVLAIKNIARYVPEVQFSVDAAQAGKIPYVEIGQPLGKYMQEYMRDVRETFFDIAETCAKDGDISIRAKAEMRVRQIRQEVDLLELQAAGTRLVWTSSHANCSKRCEPYQGRLWSLDGSYGEIDGNKYEPLENATNQYTTTKGGKIYKNSIISGFGCRHRLIAYKTGNKPIEVPAEVVEKERTINNTQRALERRVRLYRERAIAIKSQSGAEYSKWRAAAIQANKEYIAYSKDNGVAYYPSRTVVFEPESYIKARQAQ